MRHYLSTMVRFLLSTYKWRLLCFQALRDSETLRIVISVVVNNAMWKTHWQKVCRDTTVISFLGTTICQELSSSLAFVLV